MKEKNPTQTLLNTNFTTVEASTDIQVIRFIFNHFSKRFLPVISGKQFVGVILREDFMRKFVASDDNLLAAKDLISKEMIKLSPSNTLCDAMEIFDTNVFHIIPIASDDGDFLGVLLKEEVEQYLFSAPISI